MGQVNLNSIIARYQHSFGYVAANVAMIAANRLWGKLYPIPLISRPTIAGSGDEETQLFSAGDASFADMLFTNNKSGNTYGFGSYSLNASNIFYGQDGCCLAPPPMVTFSRSKNVVRTAIDRSETEVIEHFGLKPWSIKLQGILIDLSDHQYPQQLVSKLNQMFSEWGTYQAEGQLFLDLGITDVFFDADFEISFVEGFADTVKFTVSAISTQPVNFTAVGYV
ncbi:DUF6046 domain-containing protein [Williamwhitmania taraxaci]|uniref:DUF6046 domain-containing protein n=1 Tax=Williamwhitmania taraxaci TaxID=1640674 RepID=A0A1G6MAS4_9BACT|nr:DUF6046 domain-containing protein [Williamwhitmania taraxaci]SDC52613.1 hypothetical protein SAMN05216323_103520 [Williamwhitmania taraxaci]